MAPVLNFPWMLHSVGSPLVHSIINLLVKFKTFHSHLKLIPQAPPNNLRSLSSSSQAFPETKAKNNTQQVALSWNDIEMVINMLGLGNCSEKTEKQSKRQRIEDDADDDFLEVVSSLLKEKEASMDELNRAFAIFDSNGDGFIDAVELQRVMAILGFEQGMKVEECEKMIRAYDENGDGKIEFWEFKNLLEDAN